MEFYVCKRPNTNYHCINCGSLFVIYVQFLHLTKLRVIMKNNIKSEVVKHVWTSEQNADGIVEVVNLSGQVSCKKKRQSSLTSFYNTKLSFNCVTMTKTAKSKATIVMKNPSEEKARNLLKTTAESWKITSLKKYDASEWLDIITDKKGNFISIKCKVCNSNGNIFYS